MSHGWLDSNPFWAHRYALLGALYIAVVAELAIRWARSGVRPSTARLTVNVGMWAVELILRGASFGLRLGIATWVSAHAMRRLPWSLSTSLLAYVLVDLTYYWHHRLLHATRLGWAIHATHHTSEELTLLSTIRLSWVEAGIKYLFYLPIVLAGFAPLQVFLLVELNSITQFWCHTETIGRLPWLDPWLNTPHNHRLHHARARAIAECNYGSSLVIWDRLFGTYRDGAAPREYGIEDQRDSLNPFRLQFGMLWRWIQDGFRTPVERDGEHADGYQANPLGGAQRTERPLGLAAQRLQAEANDAVSNQIVPK
jgi:sterol desaturase/sphingolipid hydroxylase (fatty acid hydroxylase superfamily)